MILSYNNAYVRLKRFFSVTRFCFVTFALTFACPLWDFFFVEWLSISIAFLMHSRLVITFFSSFMFCYSFMLKFLWIFSLFYSFHHPYSFKFLRSLEMRVSSLCCSFFFIFFYLSRSILGCAIFNFPANLSPCFKFSVYKWICDEIKTVRR